MSKKLHQRAISWMLHTRFSVRVTRDVVPRVVVPYWPYGLSEPLVQEGYRLLHRGHILLSQSRLGLSSIATPGLDHAALCIFRDGKYVLPGQNRDIAEMTREDWNTVSWRDFCAKSRRVVILDCDDWSLEYKEHVVEHCLANSDIGYDQQFELGDHEWDCAELPYESDTDRKLKIDPKVNWFTGELVVYPHDFLLAENTSVVWDSAHKMLGKNKDW